MKQLLRYLVNTILLIVIWFIPATLFIGWSFSVNGTRPSGLIAIGGIIAIIISVKVVKKINKSNLWSRLFDETETVEKEVKATFRIIALLEGVSYILLMTVGLYFKYQLDDPTYVKLLGMPHGILFVSYIIFAFLIKENEKWGMKDLGIVLVASILPFGTFYVDWKYLKK